MHFPQIKIPIVHSVCVLKLKTDASRFSLTRVNSRFFILVVAYQDKRTMQSFSELTSEAIKVFVYCILQARPNFNSLYFSISSETYQGAFFDENPR